MEKMPPPAADSGLGPFADRRSSVRPFPFIFERMNGNGKKNRTVNGERQNTTFYRSSVHRLKNHENRRKLSNFVYKIAQNCQISFAKLPKIANSSEVAKFVRNLSEICIFFFLWRTYFQAVL